MFFVPINAESESALDEKNAQTFEQQQAEILRVNFETLLKIISVNHFSLKN